MKKLPIPSAFISLVCALLLSQGSFAQSKATATINADQSTHKIDADIYGHFAEHLGRCIYDGIYIGDTSSIPNTEGVRNDIIEALIDLKVPVLRWPGGCFADTYHWMDGIGPREDRPKIVNQWWGGVTEDNSFGTHDFLNLCERIGASPYLAANLGSGSVKEMADWLQYVNHDSNSPMAELRIENGREKPWNVKFWGVGNEMWGCGGHMRPEYYADLYRKYATFMSSWSNDEGIFRIASGANVDDYHWTEVLMREVPKHLIEGVALHSYSFVEWNKKGSSYDFTEAQYFSTMETAWRMEELVTKHSGIMDKYDPEKRIALIVDEWGGWYEVMPETNPGFLYQQNTMRDAMIAGLSLNIFNNHSDRVRMANLAQTVNVLQAVILTEGEKMLLTPTYHVMKMYNVHQDAAYLPMELNSSKYTFDGKSLNAVSGSASKDSLGIIHVSLVNIDAKNSQEVTLSINGTDAKKITAEVLSSNKLTDHNTFKNPEKIAPKPFKNYKSGKDGEVTITIPPYSVVVLEMN